MTNSHNQFDTTHLPEYSSPDNSEESFEFENIDEIDIAEMISEISHFLILSDGESTNDNDVVIEDTNENNSNIDPITPVKNIKPQFPKAVYILGNKVPDDLLSCINWNISRSGNRTQIGKLTQIEDGKEVNRTVYTPNQWLQKQRLVYATDFPMVAIKATDYSKLTVIDGKLTIDGKLVIKAWQYYNLHKGILSSNKLSDETISPDHPLLDPKNKTEDKLDFLVQAVFYSSGKSIPHSAKPCWTHRKKDEKSLKGFVEIDGKKFLVRSLAGWNANYRWYRMDGRMVQRTEYDNIVKKGEFYFLSELTTENQPILTPLVSLREHNRLSKKVENAIKEVVAFGLPEDLETLKQTKLNPDTIVFAYLDLPLLDLNVKLTWQKDAGNKKSPLGYAYYIDPLQGEVKAKIVHHKDYPGQRLVYNTNTKKNVPVDVSDCLKIDPSIEPLNVHGKEVLTYNRWMYQKRLLKAGKLNRNDVSSQIDTNVEIPNENIHQIDMNVEMAISKKHGKVQTATNVPSLVLVPKLDIPCESCEINNETIVYILVGDPVPPGLIVHWNQKSENAVTRIGHVYHPLNPQIAARVTYNWNYNDNYRLVYADNLETQDFVKHDDCLRLNAGLKNLRLDGRKIVTLQTWYKYKNKADQNNPPATDLGTNTNKRKRVTKEKHTRNKNQKTQEVVNAGEQISQNINLNTEMPTQVTQNPSTLFSQNQLDRIKVQQNMIALLEQKRFSEAKSLFDMAIVLRRNAQT